MVNILLDMDGVLGDFFTLALERLNDELEREVTQEGKPIQENQETASDAPSITEVNS